MQTQNVQNANGNAQVENIEGIILTPTPNSYQPKPKRSLQNTALRWLAAFFGLVLVFTFVSRASEGMTLARVTAESSKTGIITNRHTLNGVIKPLENKRLYLPEGLYITEIEAEAGEMVKAGDVILYFDKDDAEETLRKMKDDLAIAELRIENGRMPQNDSSAQNIENARVQLEEAEADYARLTEKYNASRDDMMKEIWEAGNVKADALNQEATVSDKAVADAMDALEQAREDYDYLVQKLTNTWDGLESDIQEAMAEQEEGNAGTGSGPVALAKLELEQARADRDALLDKSDTSSGRVSEDLLKAEQALKDAKAAMPEALQKARYELTSSAGDKLKIAEDNFDNISEQIQMDIDNALMNYESGLYADPGEELPETRRLYDLYMIALDSADKKEEDADEALRKAQRDLNAARTSADITGDPVVVAAQNEIDAAERAVEAAKRALEDDGVSASDQLLSAERTVEDRERDLEIAQLNAQKAIDDAWEAFNDNESDTAEQLGEAQRNIETLEKNLERAIKDAEEQAGTVKDEFDKNEESYADLLITSGRNVSDAKRSLDAATRQAGIDETTALKNMRQSQIDMIGYEAERDSLIKSIAELEEAVLLDGKLISPTDGAVLSVAALGRTDGMSPCSEIADGSMGFFFEASAGRNAAEDLAVGINGELSYINEGKRKEIDSAISSIGAANDDGQSTVEASLPEGLYPVNGSAELIVENSSDMQYTTLPLSALRSDSSGDFVLALLEKRTVTGVEFVAQRVSVDVLLQDNERMSVSGALSSEDKVITHSSKPVSEGDKVRLE